MLCKSVFFWAGVFSYGFGKGRGDIRFGNNERCMFEINGYFVSLEKGNGRGMAISHVGDLLISGTEDFIEYLPGGLVGAFSVTVFGRMMRFIYVRVLLMRQKNLLQIVEFLMVRIRFLFRLCGELITRAQSNVL